MNRIATVFFVTAAFALGGGGAALGQTVADYEAGLAKAPVGDAQSPQTEASCRVLLNYIFTSINPGGRSGITLPLVTFDTPADPEIARKRDTCETVRRQAVIQFDAGTGEEIVTPPQMTSAEVNPNANPNAYGANQPRLQSDFGPLPNEATGRRVRRPLGAPVQ